MDPVFPIANEIDHLFDRQALFYVVSKALCPVWGSNSRPSDYKTDALPTAPTEMD